VMWKVLIMYVYRITSGRGQGHVSVIPRLVFDIFYPHTIFGNSSVVPEI